MHANRLGASQCVAIAQTLGQGRRMGRADRRGMKLLLLFNTILIPAPFFAGQRSALLTESIIGWPVVVDHQVELSWPLRTLWTEMPRLTTSMRSVFHGSTAFPKFAYKKSLIAGSLDQGGRSKFCLTRKSLGWSGSGGAGHEFDAF